MSIIFYGVFAKWLSSIESRSICAFIFAFLFVFFWAPYCIRKLTEHKAGQPIRQGDLLEELHKKKKNIPTMGGVLIIAGVFFAAFFWMDLTHSFSWMLLTTLAVFALIGAYDDMLKLRKKRSKGLSARHKFFAQVLWSIVVILYVQLPAVPQEFSQTPYKRPVVKEFYKGKKVDEKTIKEHAQSVFLPFFKKPIVQLTGAGIVLLWAFYIFVIVGASNAVNLTDGLDGLATGLSLLTTAVLGLFAYLSSSESLAKTLDIAYIEKSGEIAVFCAALFGACLGFLWYNCAPAKVFMGDTGSLAIGGAFGVISILLNHAFLLGLVGGVFVMETLSVILQVASFRLRKKRIFLIAPLHHHFEYKGWPETRVVVRFWIVGLFLAILGTVSLFIGL